MVVRVLAGRYELVRVVGRGGMGEVWEGRDRVIGRRVAIKLLPHDRRDVAGAELFQREARTAGALSHPGVVTVHDFGQDGDDGSLFLVMEFLVGRDLRTVLDEDGPPPVPTAVDWAAQTAAALARAHEVDVVHRDLKPANLMLTPDGQVKILDFGIARFMESLPSSKVMGTFPYMPPERFDGHPGNARSDLYALGCVLHELLTGRKPFDATSPASMMSAHLTRTPVPPGRLRPEVPAALDDLVMELLAKAPEDRPASAAEVRDRLRGLPAAAATSRPVIADAAARTTAPATLVDPGNAETVGPESPPATLNMTRPETPATLVEPPEPTPETRSGTRLLTRRRALWLGVAAAAAGAGIKGGYALYGLGGRDDPAGSGRPWFTAGGCPLSRLVVDGEVAYVSGKDAQHSTVYALNRLSGAKKWSHRIDGAGYGDTDRKNVTVPYPLVVGGAVYVWGLDGHMYVLDAATGAKRWEYTVGGVELLTVSGGLVYVYVHHENAIHALDAATGAEKWVARAVGGIDAHAMVDEVVYAYIDNQGNLRALDLATGRKKWDLTGSYATQLWTAGGMLYVSREEDVQALDPATGAPRWTSPVDVDSKAEGAVADGAAYFFCFFKGDEYSGEAVHALDGATGKRRWSAQPASLSSARLQVADGTVYVHGTRTTYALNAATGRTKWSINRPLDGGLELAVADKLVYVNGSSDDQTVHALDAATGRTRWTSSVNGQLLLITNERLYVASDNNDAIYALDAATGAG
ncbi:protein kinase domain-containing protein [Micromonospora zhanjiangensis]|uniref:non-specific serine/threonine protein kinase n=1 Tax=Micromonospora zhanjiangensis TaxID=1522057 RepID=A0ABV8KRD7_9ACTN